MYIKNIPRSLLYLSFLFLTNCSIVYAILDEYALSQSGHVIATNSNVLIMSATEDTMTYDAGTRFYKYPLTFKNISRSEKATLSLSKVSFNAQDTSWPAECAVDGQTQNFTMKPDSKVKVLCTFKLTESEHDGLTIEDTKGFLTIPVEAGKSGKIQVPLVFYKRWKAV